ncbi:MAG: 30S ribosomal protein S2 [Candidatus Anstonellales archaeon]
MDSLLVKQEKYLESGIHIGTKLKVVDMEPYIYRKRSDGLYVLDLRKIDECLRAAAAEIGKYSSQDILVVASRTYAGNAAAKFSKIIGCKAILGRFIPGTFTNVSRSYFLEPKFVLVCDPKAERQAIVEAARMNIPVAALCDTDNPTTGVTFIVPCNNKGRRSLALIFYILAREYFMAQKRISSYDEFSLQPEDFESDDAYQETKEETKKSDVLSEPQAQDGQDAAVSETTAPKKQSKKKSLEKQKPLPPPVPQEEVTN